MSPKIEALIKAFFIAFNLFLIWSVLGGAGSSSALAWLVVLFALYNIFTLLYPSFFPNLTAEKGFNLDELSVEQVEELRQLILQGGKLEAIKRVKQLSGAGPTVAKAYVDGLERGMAKSP